MKRTRFPIKSIVLGVIVLAMIAGAVVFVATSRAGYESAAYELVEKSGAFELRDYEKLEVVATPMGDRGRSGSFRRLFRYISGDNQEERKIDMTTPVFMPAGKNGEPGTMQFVLPSEVAEEGAPAPTGEAVELATMPAGRYAVIRYSGRSGRERDRRQLDRLKGELEARGLESIGDPVFAGYDPPWTPGPLRRNEVLLRVRSIRDE